MIFGDYAGDQALASALGLPKPGPGEFVSARLARRAPAPGDYIRAFRLDGADWVLAAASDPADRPGPAKVRTAVVGQLSVTGGNDNDCYFRLLRARPGAARGRPGDNPLYHPANVSVRRYHPDHSSEPQGDDLADSQA